MTTQFSTSRFLLRSVRHHARSHLAVGLGVVVAAMVIGGALVVGDSVRDSLKALSLVRLGRVDHALVTHRFFREATVTALSESASFRERFEAAAPALVFQANFERRTSSSPANSTRVARSAGVNIYGVDERAWKFLQTQGIARPTATGVVLNARLAEQLQARTGDAVTLWVELPATIPRDSLLGGKEEQATQEVQLTVEGVLPESAGAGRFDLQPSQQFPKVAFVDLHGLQQALSLDEAAPSKRNPRGRPARVNAMFVSARQSKDGETAEAVDASQAVTRELRDALQLDDLFVRVVAQSERGYASLESERMILEDSLAEAAEDVATKLNAKTSPVLAYLVNRISRVGDDTKFSKYSIVAGVPDPSSLPEPFGPVIAADGTKLASLPADGVLLSDWLAEDLGIRPSDLSASPRPKVRVTYYVVGSKGELPEKVAEFDVHGILPMNGTLAGDRGLTPEVPGITDASTFRDWDQPFPMQLPVTKRDDEYWDKHRATPKAFFLLDAARQRWSSRYGSQTSLRISAAPGKTPDETAREFSRALLLSLDLESLGLGVQPVKWHGVRAASGTQNFAGLFIGFSFFMILSGLLLIGLLLRLGIERRSQEVGLLAAVGFTPRQVRRLLFREAFVVALVSGALGTLAAVGYAGLLIFGLRTWWVGAVGTTLLELSVRPLTLVAGFALTLAAAASSVWWALRSLKQLSPRELLAGQSEAFESASARTLRRGRTGRLALSLFGLSFVLVIAVVAGLVPSTEAFAGLSWPTVLFFVVGISTLTASLSALAVWLSGEKFAPVLGAGTAALFRLSLRNATRQRRRSLLSVALIACATFLLVAVAAGRRNPAVETPDLNSGNGGFLFVAESSTSLLQDLNTNTGREKLDVRRTAPLPKGDEATVAKDVLEQMTVASFRVKLGENASCLNLYNTRLPTVLGVPPDLIQRGGFKFADTRSSRPWELLAAEQPDGAIPVLGDMNTLLYSLKKGIGDTIAVPDEADPKAHLRIVGMLDSSVFQGVLLMSEANFLKLFPEQVGFRYFLIGDRRFEPSGAALTKEQARELSDVLETSLAPFGFDVEPVGDRLANFLAVQNTYLSTFQTLGGLGLLLGTIGLGTVMLRNVIERRSELALLRAVGFRPASVRRLVLFENAVLLTFGLVAGTASALLAMLPHLLSTGADIPWLSGAVMLMAIFAVGLLSAFTATAEAVRTPIVASLRGD